MIENYLSGNFVPVTSTYCKAVAYDAGERAIGIQYGDGEEWWYSPYSEDEARDFYDSGSKGTWAWDHIRIRGSRHRHQRGAHPA